MVHDTITRVRTLPDQEEVQLELTTLHLYIMLPHLSNAVVEFGGYC